MKIKDSVCVCDFEGQLLNELLARLRASIIARHLSFDEFLSLSALCSSAARLNKFLNDEQEVRASACRLARYYWLLSRG